MKRPHYYYCTPVESPTGLLLKDFIHRCDVASETARQWAESYGASSYYESPVGMAGGVSSLVFDGQQVKEVWEEMQTVEGEVVFVPVEGSAEEQEMYNLPVVSEVEIFSILKLQHCTDKDNKPLPMTFGDSTPVLFCQDGCYYIDVPYGVSNSPDVIGISKSDFSAAHKKRCRE